MNINETYQQHLTDILTKGSYATCRGHEIIECIGKSITIPMSEPLITLAGRRLNYKFACGEAAWIMSGSNRVEDIAYCNKRIANFSDDGEFFFGAYGVKIVEQLPYIIRAFEKDPATRQAVLTIWRERPYDSKDIPCTVSIQWLLRDGKLHVIDNMRSSDCWLGLPYDLFNFSLLSAGLAIMLSNRLGQKITLGNLTLTAGSSHLYTKKESFNYDLDDVYRCLQDEVAIEYTTFVVDEFKSYSNLVDYLTGFAHGQKATDLVYDQGLCTLNVSARPFLSEVFDAPRT
jgi:thymidylate synthase